MNKTTLQNQSLSRVLEEAKLQEHFLFYSQMALILKGDELNESDISDLHSFQAFLIESTDSVKKIQNIEVYEAKMAKLKQLYPVHDLLAKILGCLVVAKEVNKKLSKKLTERELELNKLAADYSNLLNTINL